MKIYFTFILLVIIGCGKVYTCKVYEDNYPYYYSRSGQYVRNHTKLLMALKVDNVSDSNYHVFKGISSRIIMSGAGTREPKFHALLMLFIFDKNENLKKQEILAEELDVTEEELENDFNKISFVIDGKRCVNTQ